MTSYRPPRVGDLLAVRTSDPHIGEQQVVVHTVADNGGHIFLAGHWQGIDLEVVIRRIGDIHQHPRLET